jgi:hypothetical protein
MEKEREQSARNKTQLNESMSFMYSEPLREQVRHGLGAEQGIFRPGSRGQIQIFAEIRLLAEAGVYSLNESEALMLSCEDLGEWGNWRGQTVPLGFPMVSEVWEGREWQREQNRQLRLAEAIYQGKEVELGKPKRGGSKKFYVYVNTGKKGADGKPKIKKVQWGSPDMSVKISDPKRRAAFAARHKCETRNDKTTPSYWACRTGRYPHLTGSKKSYQWW